MPIRFVPAPDGRRRAMTEGLMPLNGAEFGLEFAAEIPDAAALRVLTYVGDYIARSGQRIQAGETMRYGWTTLRFVPVAPGLLMVEELADPFALTAERYVAGAAQAITILARQDAAVVRNGVAAPGHHPHRSETAVICSRIAPGTPRRVMVFDRALPTQQRPDDSGWFIGCGDPTHDHNDVRQLALVHLVHLVDLDPRIVDYLALPEGARVVFERSRLLVFAPDAQEGRLDDGAPPLN